jgi:hypothetical protein
MSRSVRRFRQGGLAPALLLSALFVAVPNSTTAAPAAPSIAVRPDLTGNWNLNREAESTSGPPAASG